MEYFFTSRRRHTIFDCDWSSDVCSSDLVGPARPHEVDRRRLGHVDAVRGREVLGEHATRQVYAQHDRDALAARLDPGGPKPRTRRRYDPGAEADVAQRGREPRNPEALRRACRRPDVAHAHTPQPPETPRAQPPPARPGEAAQQHEPPGEAHGKNSRASARAPPVSAATSVPWADANSTRSSCSSTARSSRSGASGRARPPAARPPVVLSARLAPGTACAMATRSWSTARAATALGSPAASQRASGTSGSTGT